MDAISTIKSHQSIRKFTGACITPEQMHNIEDAILQTSSTCFLQFVTTIKITDPSKLAKLAELSGNQEHIAQCSHFLMFCLDLTKLMHCTDLKPPFSLKLLYSGLCDCGLACENALVAAEAQGLGGVVIGGYKAGMQEVSDMLKLPHGVAPLLGLCLGVPDPDYVEQQKPRLPRSWLIMENEWHDPFNEQELAAYNQDMLDYYKNRRYNQKGSTWTEASQSMLNNQKISTNIIEYLKRQGFEFI